MPRLGGMAIRQGAAAPNEKMRAHRIPFLAHSKCAISESHCWESATDCESLHLDVWKQMKILLGVLSKRVLDMAAISQVTVFDLDDNHVRVSLVGIVAALQDAHTRLERALEQYPWSTDASP